MLVFRVRRYLISLIISFYSPMLKILNSYQTWLVLNNCRAIKVQCCEFLTSLCVQRKISAKMYHMS